VALVRRALHILSIALITAGIVLALDIGLTLVWKEPLSTVYGAIRQAQAEDQLEDLQASFLETPAATNAIKQRNADELSQADVRRLASVLERQVQDGEPIGRLSVASIDIDPVVLQGTDTGTLQKGPGHYPETAFPGQGKTIGIAGHRTTYLAPFRNINEIEDGDELVLEMPYGTFRYRVQRHAIVDPSAVHIVRDVGYERLVLTACHPLYSAGQRWAVFAKLTETELGALPPDVPAGD
jgi:sortase A